MEVHNQTNTGLNSKKAHAGEAATELLDETKKLATELYEEGIKKLEAAQKEANHYSDELLEKVREHPLKAILIAGGVGLLLSALLRK